MNICMFTNTYLPHVGGVARSISCFKEDLQKRGHQVLIIAPTYSDYTDERPEDEPPDVIRLPAIQNFNGSDFSVRIPLPMVVAEAVDAFEPDIIHSHHPFLMGDAAMRTARKRGLPIVFTHHTLYEQYTHYTPVDSPAMKRFAIEISTHYANLCDHIAAPSESIKKLIKNRGVKKPVTVIPTGVDLDFFSKGKGDDFRKKHRIDPRAFVTGHVGRLALEKNLAYLARAVALFLKNNPEARFVVVGDGSAKDKLRRICRDEQVTDQLVMTGALSGQALADAYRAFNVFVFASKSETQGMVLTEAMAAGAPVVALDASGVREVLKDGQNGRLLDAKATAADFSACLQEIVRAPERLKSWKAGALQTAIDFSRKNSAKHMEDLYRLVKKAKKPLPPAGKNDFEIWEDFLKAIDVEWDLLVEKARAFIGIGESGSDRSDSEA
jgi:glycosyltransferase involved in cell wall biosynthesis